MPTMNVVVEDTIFVLRFECNLQGLDLGLEVMDAS
jgi:hypothetical protein